MSLRPNPHSPFNYTRPSRPAPGVAGDRRRQIILGLLVVALSIAVLALLAYVKVARQLPSVDALMQRAITFRSTRIMDREGGLLAETTGAEGGRRVVVDFDQIAEPLVEATVATEDANFWQHAGVDPVAIVRALWYALREGEAVSGASTIPQQLVKRVYLSPERSLSRKLKEAVLATEVSRRFSKQDIITLYLNEIFYGNHAYGVEAAAQVYFDKSAAALTLAEAALLAGLPQAPAYYDPYSYPDRAKARQAVVLGLMVKSGAIQAAQAQEAARVPLTYRSHEPAQRAPHFTLVVRQQLEEQFGPDALDKLGLAVTTTLDPRLQTAAEDSIRRQLAALAGSDVGNGALVAIHPSTSELLAYVGSADFSDAAIAGQIDMALAPRQPGSALKPFVYLAAMEHTRTGGDAAITPETLVMDVERDFPDGAGGYHPRNYDLREHGMVTLRAALANSYNLPAVAMLEQTGLRPFIDLLTRLGISTLTRDDYGLSIALGAAEMPLLELTQAYAVLATGGLRLPARSIREVRDMDGKLLCGEGAAETCGEADSSAAVRQVLDAAEAFLITDMLADNEARTPAFGRDSALNLGRPAAAKTGTTNDFRDNWAVGFTPQLVTGVWVGNADNRPMRGVSGISGAAPIWQAFMRLALASEAAGEFVVPDGVRRHTICADTGTQPGSACPATRSAWFADDRPPLGSAADPHRRVAIDRRSGLLAGPDSPPEAVEERDYLVYPPEWRAWAAAHGIAQPPDTVATEEATAEATVEATASATPSARATGTVATPMASATVGRTATATATSGGDPGASATPTPDIRATDTPTSTPSTTPKPSATPIVSARTR